MVATSPLAALMGGGGDPPPGNLSPEMKSKIAAAIAGMPPLMPMGAIPSGGGGPAAHGATASGAIPLPDFSNAKARGQYATNFVKKYGDVFKGYGDTALNVNQIPRGGSSTMKNIATSAAKQYGIDPALLYTSAMVEGASGLFKSQATGLDSKNRKPGDYGYQDFYGDKEFPIHGDSFGFTQMSTRIPDLIKQGYLPKGFEKNVRGKANEGQFNSEDFKSAETAMQAKAALLKYHGDEVDREAKKYGLNLSPKAREFFMLAAYNGGEGALKRIKRYADAGLLKDDNFLVNRPASEERVKNTYADVWGHVAPRLKMRDAFKSEKLFE